MRYKKFLSVSEVGPIESCRLWREEGWIKEVPDDCFFHDAGEDWSDRDWPEVSVLRGGRKFRYWLDGG